MSHVLATVAAIFWVALWHWSGFPLLAGFPPALLVFGSTWVFGAWVWPSAMRPDGVQAWRI